MDNQGAVIVRVEPGSIADEMGIEAGDRVLSINGAPLEDLIDYRFQVAGEYIELEILKPHGEEWLLEIEKAYDETLGLDFAQSTFDGINRCHNKCIFCFVDQMPPGMRNTLYVKDDDYRMSVLHGNFITGTNLTQEKVDRIIRFHLSPLYFSVHTTNPSLRVKMLNNNKAGEVLKYLRDMAAAGIDIHTQIVLCPGINDGTELDRTIGDLADLYPQIQSIAVVPVGLTNYRTQLAALQSFDAEAAGMVIQQVTKWQQEFHKKYQNTLVYLADEFYLLAGKPIPDRSHYGEFAQIENGVGLVRLFIDSFQEEASGLPQQVQPPRKITLATGVSGAKVLVDPVSRLNQVDGVDINLLEVANQHFGHRVTVAGLLTGKDLLRALEGIDLGNVLILPSVMLKAGENIFLDGMTVSELEQSLGVEIRIVDAQDGKQLVKEVLR